MDTQELLKTPEWMAQDSNGAGLTQAARALDDSEEEVPFESGSPFHGFPSENGLTAVDLEESEGKFLQLMQY